MFLKAPNLPEAQVRHIIIGEKYKYLIENTDFCYKHDVIWLPDNPFADERLSGHCDLAAVHTGERGLILSEYLRNTEFSEKLEAIGAELSYVENPTSKEYPHDAYMNVCALKKQLIANTRVNCSKIVNYLSINRELIDVNQGYARCSVCVVAENAIITADRVIAEKAKAHGMDTLLINEGFFELSGYDYGFIGGSAFKTENDTLIFTGMIDAHPNAAEIISFAVSHGVHIEYMTDRKAFDIGSAIPLTEY